MNIDYEKYTHMDRKQLLNSLISAEKKEQKIKIQAEKKLNETNELIKFLKAKIKQSLDKPKYEFLTREQTKLDKISEKIKQELPLKEQEQIKQELQNEMNKDYNNVL